MFMLLVAGSCTDAFEHITVSLILYILFGATELLAIGLPIPSRAFRAECNTSSQHRFLESHFSTCFVSTGFLGQSQYRRCCPKPGCRSLYVLISLTHSLTQSLTLSLTHSLYTPLSLSLPAVFRCLSEIMTMPRTATLWLWERTWVTLTLPKEPPPRQSQTILEAGQSLVA